MLNFIQEKLVIANPTNITPSLREATLVATKQSRKVIRNGQLDRIIGSQYKGVQGFSLDYVMGQGWKRHDTFNSNQPPRSLYDIIYDEAGSTNASILLKKSEDPRVKFHTPYNQYLNNKKTVNNTKLGDKPPTQSNNPPAAPNIPQGSWDYTLAMLGISPAGDALVTPKILPAGGGLPKSVLFKPSNKPSLEATEFKWTEEGMAKLLAASQTKDELDVKLQEIIRANPEITQKIEEHGRSDNLKQQLVGVAKELFWVSEAQAGPALTIAAGMAVGGAAEGAGFVATAGTIGGGAAAITGIMNAPKDALVEWLLENIGDEPSDQILKIALTLAAYPESITNVINPQQQSELEKRKHDKSKAPPATTDYQEVKEKGGKIATGFAPDPGEDPEEEQKNLHNQRKNQEQFNECEQSESPIWKEFKHYKVIDGKPTRTNGLQGKNQRFFQWDDLHKEVEMYNRKGKPMDALDPVTGKMKNKNVSSHQPLNIR